jgi:DNA (cytosine-5)-methyltransferase 1
MNHGSLFSGIGGFDLAAEWMGWDNVFHCEWMPFPRQVLHYHFPKSLSYEDITKTDFTIHRGTIDILTGGFPCQPYSSAGKRLGKEDERHLWPHMLRAIQEIEPTYVVGENVRGLTNWNGGVVFEEVCADLESCGYEVQPILLPAAAVGAPHRRDRIWFIAYNNSIIWGERGKFEFREQSRHEKSNEKSNTKVDRNATNTDSIRFKQCECDNEEQSSERGVNAFNDTYSNDEQGITSDTERIRFQIGSEKRNIRQEKEKTFEKRSESSISIKTNGSRFISNQWQSFPTQSPICGGDDGLPTELDGITFSKWRAESIKAYGNAIVPQVAYEIFKVIEQLHYDKIPR